MSRTVDSLRAHRRRLRARRAIETLRSRVLPLVLVALLGATVAAVMIALGGGVL